MDELLLVRLGESMESPVDWLIWHHAERRVIEYGVLDDSRQLEQLSELSQQRPCYVLVPQEQVLTTEVLLPHAGRAARAAIPYQLEEQLCLDPDQQHFAVASGDGANRYHVCVVEHDRMRGWQQVLQAARLTVRGLYADAQVLAVSGEEWTVVPQGKRVLIKGPTVSGLGLQRAELATWQALLPADLDVPAADEAVPALAHVAALLNLGAAINLLQGPYKLQDPVAQLVKQWRLPVVLGLVLIFLQLLGLGVEHYQLKQRKSALDAQVEQLYREAFPDARRIVNPRLQLERGIEQMRTAQSGAPMLRALERSLAAFKQPGVKPSGLRYSADEARLVIELEAEDYQALQQFNNVLTDAGLVSQLGQFSAQGQRTRGQVTIEEVR